VGAGRLMSQLAYLGQEPVEVAPSGTAPDQQRPPTGPPVSASGAIHVSLGVFEGPLDLLLSLIERKGLPVAEVSVVAVAGQFLEQIRAWQQVDIAITAEFLVLAARLLLLKSRALLPRPPQPEEGGREGVDADADARDLVDRLVVYKAFQNLATHLRAWQEEGRASYARLELGALPSYLLSPPLDPAAERAGLARAALRCLRRAQRRQGQAPRAVPPSPLDLDFGAVLRDVSHRVAHGPAAGQPFAALLPQDAPILMVVATFLALLELVRHGVARLIQEHAFAPLLVAPGHATGQPLAEAVELAGVAGA